MHKYSVLSYLNASLVSMVGLMAGGITTAQAEVSAHVGLLSSYVYRGAEENDGLTIQAGVEYEHASGAYLGYWGSSLGYSPRHEYKDHDIEHDFFVGYRGALSPKWQYDTQVVSYVYQHGGSVRDDADKRHTTALEWLTNVNYQDLSLGVGVMLKDASWANAGDVYLSAGYDYALPQDFLLSTSIGVSLYNGNNDDPLLTTKKDVVLSELRVGVSRAIFDSNFEGSVEYVWGGKDRAAEDLDQQAIVGLSYHF